MKSSLNKLLGGSAILFGMWGCDASDLQKSAQPVMQPSQAEVACQRFIPVTPDTNRQGVPWSGFFALDTKTGQLCRTTSWEFNNPNWDTLPTCYSLNESENKKVDFRRF